MKVSNEHYNTLKVWAIQQMKDSNLSKSDIEKNFEGVSEERKLWDFYWFATSSPIASMTVRPLFNEYNDAHITTALRKLYSEIE